MNQSRKQKKTELFELYQSVKLPLMGFLCGYLKNQNEAEEIFQEAFSRLLKQISDGKELCQPRAFLYRVARNLAIDLLREKNRRVDFCLELLPAKKAGEYSKPKAEDQHAKLNGEIAKLPELQREVLQLKIWSGFTYEVIAELLEAPLSTVISRYHYSLEKLRTIFGAEAEEIE